MNEIILTKEEQILVLGTQIKERALIIYTLESSIADEHESWPIGYKTALEDEVENHNAVLQEYKELLKQLTND